MGRSTLKEHGVLKLVHPGGLVEIHTIPITADEVMKKNPKHCVARPDVFQNPWLVVRPESVLKPGCVFYIVPHHTMRKLMLKAQEKQNEQCKMMMMIKHSKDNVSNFKHGSSSSSSGTQNGSKNSRVSCDDQSGIEYSSVDLSNFSSMKDMMMSSHAVDKNEDTFKSVEMGTCVSKSPVLSCSVLTNSCEESGVRKERNHQATKSSNRIMPMNNGEFQKSGYLVELTSSKDQKQSEKVETFHISEKSKSATGLKSCLKTHMNANTTDLRVRFMLPGDEEKIMRTRLWLLEISL